MLFKRQVLWMLYSSYPDIKPEDINRDEWLVRESPKWSWFDYWIHIWKLLSIYWPPKSIDTESCYPTNWIRCETKIVWPYFNVNYNPEDVFMYVSKLIWPIDIWPIDLEENISSNDMNICDIKNDLNGKSIILSILGIHYIPFEQ